MKGGVGPEEGGNLPARASKTASSLGHIRRPIEAVIPVVAGVTKARGVFVESEDEIEPVTLSGCDMAIFTDDRWEGPLVADSKALCAPKMDREGVPSGVDEVVGQT